MATIWYEDPGDFWSAERVFEVVPDLSAPYVDRLNRVLRGVLYVSLLATIVTLDPKGMYPAVIAMIVTAVLANVDASHDGFALYGGGGGGGGGRGSGGARRRRCVRPSKDNPFMNVLMSDYTERPRRGEACDGSSVREEVRDRYRENLYADVEDVYQREAAARTFYTMPSTTIPNDQGSFARWLYEVDGKTCKEGNGRRCPYFTTHAV